MVRQEEKESSEFESDPREACKYGEECYQKNPAHLKRYKHPKADTETDSITTAEKNVAGDGDDIEKKKNKEERAAAPVKKRSGDKEDDEEVEKPETKRIKLSLDEAGVEITKKYLVKMPNDFFRLWEFCLTIDTENPENALIKTCGLKLVGPYDILAGKRFKSGDDNEGKFLTHWRYYFDPPEFQTILAKVEEDGTPSEDGVHFGYFRDDPNEDPIFVGSAKGDSCKITPVGENVFAAVCGLLRDEMLKSDPFRSSTLHKLRERIHTFTSMKYDFPLDLKTQKMKTRDKKKLAATFHGAGLVVPYNKDTQVGYREIPETTQSLKKIFGNIVDSEEGEDRDEKFDVLQELVTNVQFANDEGDPGMGLELGLDLFCFGGGEVFNSTIEHLLTVAYELLNRQAFGKIIKAHLKKRTKNFTRLEEII